MEGDGAGHWRYRILGPLGEGGASKVYRALDLATGSEVALKTADGATAVSLKMEYARLHRLRHPGLVRALDFHRAGGRAFLSLELLEAPVPAVISGPGGIRPAMETWAALASVLRHLHGNGLVHGDIKPENVRFSDGAAKLIDLGLAGSPRQTGRPGFAGTPACAAPEALQRGEVSPAGDVYGLGLLIWEMLGGIGPGPELKLDPGERWLEDMPPGLAPAAGEMLRAMLRCRPLDRVRDGVQLAWAMAEAGLMPDQALAAEMPFCGRRRELRQALAACRQGAGLIAIRARPGTGGTRFLEELKFLLQLAGSEAVMAGKGRGRSLERAPPGCFVLREGEAELPEGGGRRIVELAAGPEEDAGTPTVLLRGLGSGDYREMLGRLLQGAYPEDLENLAGWLEEQAGGHVKTAAALLDALIRRRLVYPERIHWVADWQGILALDAGAAVEDVWAGRWEALAESQRSRLKGLALAGKAPAGGEGTGLALAEWTRSGEGGLRFAGEAVRGLAAGRCTGEECAAAAGRGGMGEPSPALLRACLKAGDAEAWLAHCRTLLLRASEENDREAALRYSMLLADSGLLAGDELRTEVIRAAGLCRSLARYRPGLELLERRWGELGGGWELFKTAILLRLAAGQPGPAAESARQAIESLSGAGREAVEAKLFLGLASAAAGGLKQGEEIVLEAAREAAASGDKALRMQAEERLASLAHRAGDWEAVVRHSRAGLELAGKDAHAGEVDSLVSMLGNGLTQCNRPAEAVDLLEGFISKSTGLVQTPEMGNMFACLGLACVKLEKWEQALENLGRAEYHLRRSGDLRHLAFIAANTAMAHGAAGRHRLEKKKMLEAFELSIQAGDLNSAAVCLGNAGFKQAVLGDRDGAGRTLEQALEMAAGPECGLARMLINKHLGLLACEGRQYREALAFIGRSRGEAGALGLAPHFEAAVFGAIASLCLGDHEAAREGWETAGKLSANPRQVIWADFTKELSMAHEGTGDGSLLPEAIGRMREQGRPRDAALMALAAAEAPAGPGASGPWELLAHLVAAEAEFGRLGDQGLRARARDAIVETARALAEGRGPAGGQAMLEAFYQLAFLLGSGAGSGRVGREAVEQAVRLSEAERGGLFTLDETGRPALLSGVGLDPDTVRDAADISMKAISQAARGEAEVFSNDALAEEEFRSRLSVQRNAIRSIACVPIRFREGGAGALYLDSRLKPGAFSAGRRHFLRALAAMAGAVVETSRLMEELRAGRGGSESLEGLIGTSGPMHELKERIRRAAPSGVNVMIEGETGTGKELAARAIHQLSPRRDKPFVALDCGSLPETLLESELFGCAKGAFTGAQADKPGLIEAADGGTLFLDEITSASQPVQARLLRAVEAGEIRRVGETRARKVDVRLICAANKDMEFEVGEGRFKQDLYFRLNEFRLTVPPLRDRGRDVLDLAEHFRLKHQKRHGKRGLVFTPGARKAMSSHPWPGNIREMENAVQRAVIMCHDGQITEQDLELPVDTWKPVTQEDRRKKGVTRRMLLNALKETGRDTAKAAAILGITQRQVQRLAKRFRAAT